MVKIIFKSIFLNFYQINAYILKAAYAAFLAAWVMEYELATTDFF